MNRLHDNELDRLFAERLDELQVEPPERAWRKVAAGIAVGTPLTATAFSTIVRPMIWSLSVVSTSLLLIVSDTPQSELYPEQQFVVAENHEISTTPNPVQEAEAEQLTSMQPLAGNLIPITVEAEKTIPANTVALPNPVLTEQTTVITEAMDTPEKLNLRRNLIPEIALQISTPSKHPLPELSNGNVIIPAWFDISAESGPDIFAFGDPLLPENRSLAFNSGVSTSFHFSDFYLRTGVNVLNLSHQNLYHYTVNDYQQIGTYTMVDSVTFIEGVDTAGQIIWIPQYYTSTHPMFDSVEVERSIEATDRYRYIEIPFSLGINKNIGHITLFAQTGFSYSFLLNQKLFSEEDFANLSPDNTLSWESQSATPVKNFWSFTLSGGAYYTWNRGISLGLEPTYRYSLDPVFVSGEQSSLKPVSYGLRLRMTYDF